MQLSLHIRQLQLVPCKDALREIPDGKVLINTVNAWSFVCAQEDPEFARALLRSDYLLPDGISMVKACKWLRYEPRPRERIAGADLFAFEMERLNARGGVCFFMGSSPQVLRRITERAAKDYPRIRVVTYSPPYKPDFSAEDNRAILEAIHAADPDLLWIGMTAPKQEKWAAAHWDDLRIHCPCGTIGAVFDFYAGTRRRAPLLWQKAGLEWLYRLLREPRRMARRYLWGNLRFLRLVRKEKKLSL